MTSEQEEVVVSGLVLGKTHREIAAEAGLGSHTTVGRFAAKPETQRRVREMNRRLRSAAARLQRNREAKAAAAKLKHDQAHGVGPRVRSGDPAPGGGQHTVDSAMGIVPGPPPVPDSEATAPEYRPRPQPMPAHADERRRRRRRGGPVRFMSSLGTRFESPLDAQARLERGAQPYGLAAFRPVTSGPDYEDWLDAQERVLVARDPSGKRVFRISPSLRAEYEADGFVVTP